MIPINSENARFLLQYTLPTVKNEHRSTRSVIEAIPQAHLDYKPDPFSKTAMELAWHIVAAEHRFYGGIVSGAFDFSRFTGRRACGRPPRSASGTAIRLRGILSGLPNCPVNS